MPAAGTDAEVLASRIDGLLREQDLLQRAHADLHTELRRAVDVASGDAEERVKVALQAINARLDVLNEFRGSLEDSLKNNVSRDIFDIVTNRVTIVENTYVKKEELGREIVSNRERMDAEFKSRDGRLSELEKNTVRQEALTAQSDEVARTRKALVYAVIAGAILTILNFAINAYQAGAGR